jgi:lipoyl(octanoyl) transferase
MVAERQRGERRDALVLVEHPHVITVGRTRGALAHILAAGEVDVVEVERGGDVTYHGPGQIVAYPILLLGEGERDLHRFLRNLEEAMIRTLARWDIAGDREPGKTGVWIAGRRKIASIGIACRRWVTFHGLALNVTTDLTYFARIQPCGFDAAVMTSMARELDREAPLADVKAALIEELGHALGRSFVAGSLTPSPR